MMADQPKSWADEKTSPLTLLYSLLKGYFFAIFGAAVLALALRVFVVEAFRIPIDFMAPALMPGDHIFVNKLAYGSLGSEMPGRGEVVVFSFPSDPTKDYIKRVIAVGGDKIELKSGVLWLNGKAVGRRSAQADSFDEEIDGHSYQVHWTGTQEESRNLREIKVPEGQVFVLGDNRGKGQDSRSWGFVPASQMKGRASFIWFSRSSSGEGAGFLGVRWDRLLKKVR